MKVLPVIRIHYVEPNNALFFVRLGRATARHHPAVTTASYFRARRATVARGIHGDGDVVAQPCGWSYIR